MEILQWPISKHSRAAAGAWDRRLSAREQGTSDREGREKEWRRQ